MADERSRLPVQGCGSEALVGRVSPTAGETAGSATPAGRLFDVLDRNDIRYCHFKSNADVAAGVAGVTDLDVLVDPRQAVLMEKILAQHGFKSFPAHSSRRYPGVDDFFALDEETGRLLHFHLHYRLIVGERFFKNYRLPWEEEFLERRLVDEGTGVFVVDPGLEWLLLVCRAALKIRWRDRLRARVTPRPGEHGALFTEHSWLAGRVDAAAPAAHARRLLGARAADLVALALADDLRFRRLAALRRELLHSPNVHRGYGVVPAVWIRWSRELWWILGTLNRRHFHRAFPYARSGSGGGVVIAVIGSDGAGKSSVTQLLHSWLAGKIDVVPIYFGSGQGHSSILRWPLKVALRVVRGASPSPRMDPVERRTREVGFARAVWALVLAREKRAKLRRAVRARERGMIVICDRYPQTQVDGANDGPLLWRWRESGGRLKPALARWERRIYRLAENVGPDVVVRLLVTAETAAQRRPQDDPRELVFRTRLVKDLRFGSAQHGVIDIDADAELDAVVLDVKRRLWPVI